MRRHGSWREYAVRGRAWTIHNCPAPSRTHSTSIGVKAPDFEVKCFSIERDVKNQGKTTIKVNVQVGKEILGKIDMPEHKSAMKELDRGRLLFYVTFDGGKGYLDKEIFMRDIINA